MAIVLEIPRKTSAIEFILVKLPGLQLCYELWKPRRLIQKKKKKKKKIKTIFQGQINTRNLEIFCETKLN